MFSQIPDIFVTSYVRMLAKILILSIGWQSKKEFNGKKNLKKYKSSVVLSMKATYSSP